ncbi:riboflavin synthase [Candidatus Omnitrophota bacterium]
MFNGIIEELGTVKSLDNSGAICQLQVLAPKIAGGTELGQSISVNGICLTVVRNQRQQLSFEVMPETLNTTNLDQLRTPDQVNLERALMVQGRLDGHFVTGHIDGVAEVVELVRQGADVEMKIKASTQIMRYITPKGSIAVDGVSLTVSSCGTEAFGSGAFGVHLIPYTLQHTTLGQRKVGQRVNLEADILAKYIDRLSFAKQPANSKITANFLQQHGFDS